MFLRRTIFLPAKNTGDVVKLEIYESEDIGNICAGWWYLEENKLVLSHAGYGEFCNCRDQKQQAAFCKRLGKIEPAQPVYIGPSTGEHY